MTSDRAGLVDRSPERHLLRAGNRPIRRERVGRQRRVAGPHCHHASHRLLLVTASYFGATSSSSFETTKVETVPRSTY